MDPKQILLDLQQELHGELLSETFEVRGRKFEMRLLNEEETSWAFGFMNARSEMSLAMSARIATLSIGIKSISGVSIEDLFSDALALLMEDQEDEYNDLLNKNAGRLDFASFELFMGYLKEQPATFVNELNKCWQALEKRRDVASGEVKNLSGEASEKEMKNISTESSPDGESLQ